MLQLKRCLFIASAERRLLSKLKYEERGRIRFIYLRHIFCLLYSFRNEKYLAAVASGKWILHKSYLEASREASKFVDETQHEWGHNLDQSEFAVSGKRWRVELSAKRAQDPKIGAFKGWVILLCIEASKQPGFKRILEAGGGRVQSVRPPFENIDGATHAFIGGE